MALLPALIAGCIGNMTPVQRMQDAVNDLTTATRFSRMDIALERVARTGREEFLQRHAAWGSSLRIADCDVAGVRLADKEHATVNVMVSWQRIDESELRSTQILQKWQDHNGRWLLHSEERLGGDVGLLGEATTVVRSAPNRVQFGSITIR
jgi:hypothetical protein